MANFEHVIASWIDSTIWLSLLTTKNLAFLGKKIVFHVVTSELGWPVRL